MLNYEDILEKTRKYYFEKVYKLNVLNIPKDFIIMNLFNLVSYILNQEEFDYQYFFSKEDIEFISEFKINIIELIDFVK